MTASRVFLVDSFTDTPFAGNPAAVLLLPGPPDDDVARRIGAELDEPATALVWPLAEPGRFGLRWMTASTELQLCGHGTLAAARVLAGQGRAGGDGALRFETVAGELTARVDGGRVELEFPALPAVPTDDPGTVAAIERVLGRADFRLLRSELDLLAVLPDEDAVAGARPDPTELLAVDARGLIVSALSERPGVDFVSRFFAPSTGQLEDSVTGSAHCVLAPLWIAELGREPLVGHQISARGGFVTVSLAGDRVRLAGDAVVLSEGSWLI